LAAASNCAAEAYARCETPPFRSAAQIAYKAGSLSIARMPDPMTAFYAYTLAIVQGITELFPISSLGHAVILAPLLGWPIDQKAPTFLPFIVILHVGTATALLLYFWRDWLYILRGVLGLAAYRGDVWEARRLLGLIVAATVPAAAIGLLFERAVRGMFASPFLAALFLIANGFVLLIGDRLRNRERAASRADEASLQGLNLRGALLIGLFQSAAFIPGISRSGVAMVGGLLTGLRHSEAAHFSFLIATPIIAGAAMLEVPKMLALPDAGISGLAVAAGCVAGVTAFLSTAFLMSYFRRYNFDNAMVPFAIYCWVAGAAAMLYLGLHG
jgi:undecaprenyl-diphosphatase